MQPIIQIPTRKQRGKLEILVNARNEEIINITNKAISMKIENDFAQTAV